MPPSSIAYYQRALKGKLQSVAGIQRFEESDHFLEVIAGSMEISEYYSEIQDIVHYAGLKEVLEKLVVRHSPSGLHLDNEMFVPVLGMSLEGLLGNPLHTEQDRNRNLLAFFLPPLDFEANLRQSFLREYLVFDGRNFRTSSPNTFIELICKGEFDLRTGYHTKRVVVFDDPFCMVARTGFEPVLPA